jgi:ATP-dependent DNA ligase
VISDEPIEVIIGDRSFEIGQALFNQHTPVVFVEGERIERRKVLLIRLLAKAPVGLQINDHIVDPGDVVFRHACQLGFEGVVSKRLGSPYRSGRSQHWIKSKNPKHPAVKREAEEDWN